MTNVEWLYVLAAMIYWVCLMATVFMAAYFLNEMHRLGVYLRYGSMSGQIVEKQYTPGCVEEWPYLILGFIPYKLCVCRPERWVLVVKNSRGNLRQVLVAAHDYHNVPLLSQWRG